MRIDSTGNVGIGTISPAVRLDVNGTAWLRGNGTGLYVNSSGNVGIGTTSPSQKLDVNGNVSLGGDITFTNTAARTISMPTGSNVHDRHLTIQAASVTGVGWRPGNLNLFAGSNTNASSDGGNVVVRAGAGETPGDSGTISLQTGDTTARLTVQADGNIAINNSIASLGGNITLTSAADRIISMPTILDTAQNRLFTIKAADNSGIGWNAGDLLLRAGSNTSVSSDANNLGGDVFIRAGAGGVGAAAGTIQLLKGDGTVGLLMNASGNIGVGTSSPAYKLDVYGDINTTGDIRKNGTAYTNPDYVFEPDYPLMPIADLKLYVGENKHLPGVPSSEDILRDGVRLFEQTRLNLEKTEEAYLYLFDLDDKVSAMSLSLPSSSDSRLNNVIPSKAEGSQLDSGSGSGMTEQDTLELSHFDDENVSTLAGLLDGIDIDAETGSWEVKREIHFLEHLIARAQALFEKAVTFLAEVTFGERVTFEDRDMGGFAIIKTGADEVEVVFEKPYAQTPIITVSLFTGDMTTEEKILNADLTWGIKEESSKGFTLKLNKAAPVDTRFSWSALAINDARTTESADTSDIPEPNESVPGDQIDASQTPAQLEEPEASASSSASIEQTAEIDIADQLDSHGEPTVATSSAAQ